MIPAPALTTAGNAAVHVVNPGNLTSNTAQFNVLGAVTVTSVNPSTLSAGGTSDRRRCAAYNVRSVTSLSATVPQTLLTTARAVSVSVRNPDGAVSSGVNLTVAPPVPALSLECPSDDYACGQV